MRSWFGSGYQLDLLRMEIPLFYLKCSFQDFFAGTLGMHLTNLIDFTTYFLRP